MAVFLSFLWFLFFALRYRVGGSCIGGGTYWGLMKQLTGATDFGMAIEASRTGKPEHVDMLVGDIYGGDYANFGLSSTTVASAFGKLMRSNVGGVMPGDIASSLLHMIASNIGQLAYLYAQQHNCERILFAGNFLRTNSMSAGFIGTSIRYYSKNKMQALFLKHEGYFGAIGAYFLLFLFVFCSLSLFFSSFVCFVRSLENVVSNQVLTCLALISSPLCFLPCFFLDVRPSDHDVGAFLSTMETETESSEK